MILSKQGSEFNYNGKKYIIGEPIIGTQQSEYKGLYGNITEIRDGVDKETENDTPDIYCFFELPVFSHDLKEPEKRFSKLYVETKNVEDIILDEVIMAPEMIEPLRLFNENNCSLKIYTVCENWALEGNNGNSEAFFTDIEDAKRNYAKKLADEMKNSYAMERRGEESSVYESGDNFYKCYECYERDKHCENYYKISIQEKTLLMSHKTSENLGRRYIDECRKQDLISNIMQNDDCDNTSDEELQKLLESSNISEVVDKELENNDLYWNSISNAAEKLLKNGIKE